MEHNEREHVRAVVLRYLRSRWGRPVQFAVALAALMFVFVSASLETEPEALPEPAGPVSTVGVVESLERRGVGSPFDGAVAALFVREGDRVRRGQPLFRMDTTRLAAELHAAEAELAAARADLRSRRQEREADLAGFRRDLAALREQLRAAQAADPWSGAPMGSADPALVESLQAAIETAERDLRERAAAWAPVLAEAEERAERAERRTDQLRRLLAAAERRSPADGVVIAIYARVGETVPAATPVVRIDDPSGYRVVALVDQKARQAIRRGARVPLREPQGAETGRVERIVAGWDRELFRYWVWVKPESAEGLAPGQSVQLLLPSETQVASGR